MKKRRMEINRGSSVVVIGVIRISNVRDTHER